MELFNNFAKTTLTAAINADDASINVASGSVFPAPANGDYFMVVLAKPSVGEETTWEICKCTARNNNTLTVERGQEGTTAKSWAIGDKAENRLTAGALQRLSSSSSNGGGMTYGGMTYGGKVTITASQSQSDPSQGRGRLFRITIVGAGGGGCNGTGSYGGGGGETIIKVIPYTDISWPIYITVGQGIKNGNGGSTSFGNLITAYGGQVSNGSGYGGVAGGHVANRTTVLFVAPHGNSSYYKFYGGGIAAVGSSYINSGNAIYVTGGGGDANTGVNSNGKGGSCFPYLGGLSESYAGGGGASLLGSGGNGSYDSKAGDGDIGGGGGSYGQFSSWATHQSYVGKGGNGVCIIEWFE
jgi:hypothetical protein